MKETLLNKLAREMVGDGGLHNLYFASDLEGEVKAVFDCNTLQEAIDAAI